MDNSIVKEIAQFDIFALVQSQIKFQNSRGVA